MEKVRYKRENLDSCVRIFQGNVGKYFAEREFFVPTEVEKNGYQEGLDKVYMRYNWDKLTRAFTGLAGATRLGFGMNSRFR